MLLVTIIPIIGFLVAWFLDILFLKITAEKAYKIKTTYKRAFIQWAWLALIRFLILISTILLSFWIAIILGTYKPGVW